MKKINKTAFVAAIKSGPSLFCGVSLVRNLDADRLFDAMSQVDALNPSGYDLRTVTVRRSTFLEFSNGSRLYLDGQEYFRQGAALAVVIYGEMDKVIMYRLADCEVSR